MLKLTVPKIKAKPSRIQFIRYSITSLRLHSFRSIGSLLSPSQKVGDALIAINNVSVQGLPFNHTMNKMKKSLREDPCIVLRFRTMEERYRLLRMKVRYAADEKGAKRRRSSKAWLNQPELTQALRNCCIVACCMYKHKTRVNY